MNKGEFIDFIAKRQSCSKVEAEKTINSFIQGIIEVLGKNEEVNFIGFGKFYKSQVEAREGVNPKTKEKMQIGAYVQPKFKPGQALKDACNV